MPHYTRTFTTTCPSELIDSINTDGSIVPICLQIINLGDGNSIFDFDSSLSVGEESNLDTILASWVCPSDAGGPINPGGDQEFDDTLPADTDVIWSSNKIENTFAPLTRTINGVLSISGGGDLTADRSVSLVNDLDTPGNNKLYGTDGTGTKGWYDQPSGGGGGLVGSLHQMVFNEYGTAQNEWLEYYGDSKYSNNSHGIMPFQSKLVAITWSCKTADADVEISVYSTPEGGGVSPKTLDLQWSLVNKRVARKTNFGSDIIFDAGDKVAIYVRDTGTNPQSVTVVLYFEILTINSEENGENFSGSYATSSGGGSD
jgi:hypothetical protein